jgi:queuine/archaeosine tRNA-ribosyltransferase
MKRFIGNKPLETPALVVSYRIGDYPRAGLRNYPWEMTGTQAILLNAFDLLANKRTKIFAQHIQQCEGRIHEYVEFNGPIILDSGAFNFLQHQEISITPIDVLNIGLETDTDVLVALDHPFPPTATPEEILIRLARTQSNTQAMFEALAMHNGLVRKSFRLMPVLHGHNIETLKRSLDNIVAVTGHEPDIVGIGSLAPLAKNGNTRKAVDVILYARKMLPKAHIHVFSMGSALLMLFAFYCGADTVDSQTWIMTAAFKQVQLPGFHQTRFSKREAEVNPTTYQQIRYAFVQQLLRLIQDERFVARNWDTGDRWPIATECEALAYLDYLEDSRGINHIHRRACHNLYSFNFEASRMCQAIEKGIIETFIQGRMKNTIYRQAFEYAVSRKAALHGKG